MPDLDLSLLDPAVAGAIVDLYDAEGRDTAEMSDIEAAIVTAAAARLRAEGATPTPPPAAPSRVARPAHTRPAPRTASGRLVRADDTPYRTETEVHDALALALDQAQRSPVGQQPLRHLVARAHADDDLPTMTDSASSNAALVASARIGAITAAGGLCSPVPTRYDNVLRGILATADRPVTAVLERFDAIRGGIRYVVPPSIGELAGAVGVWTEANDRAAAADPPTANPAAKPFLRIPCEEDEQTAKVDAITAQLVWSNWADRYSPESVAAWAQLLAAEHARLAEVTILGKLLGGSVAVTSGKFLSATRDLLEIVDRAGARMRSRERMLPNATLTLVLPAWVRDWMRADLTRQHPGDSTLAMADAQISELFSTRHVRVAFSLDLDPLTTAQDAGPLTAWPATARMILFPPGKWVWLDGGTLDLGTMRTAEDVAVNDVRAFMETLEQTVAMGAGQSLAITATTAATGEAQGAKAA